jgi:uncharacterized membrane protein YfcA
MLLLTAKWTVLIFGVFIIAVGLLMLFAPKKARQTLRKAGSTNLINYAEITIRMIPAAGLILYSDLSRYPDFFKILGWVMIITSVVLYFVPRQLHHNYSLYCAELLKPLYFQLISPVAVLFGLFIIYSVL